MPYVIEQKETSSKYGVIWSRVPSRKGSLDPNISEQEARASAQELEKGTGSQHRYRYLTEAEYSEYTRPPTKERPFQGTIVTTPETRAMRQKEKRSREEKVLAEQALVKGFAGEQLSPSEKRALRRAKEVRYDLGYGEITGTGETALVRMGMEKEKQAEQIKILQGSVSKDWTSRFEATASKLKFETAEEARSAGWEVEERIIETPSTKREPPISGLPTPKELLMMQDIGADPEPYLNTSKDVPRLFNTDKTMADVTPLITPSKKGTPDAMISARKEQPMIFYDSSIPSAKDILSTEDYKQLDIIMKGVKETRREEKVGRSMVFDKPAKQFVTVLTYKGLPKAKKAVPYAVGFGALAVLSPPLAGAVAIGSSPFLVKDIQTRIATEGTVATIAEEAPTFALFGATYKGGIKVRGSISALRTRAEATWIESGLESTYKKVRYDYKPEPFYVREGAEMPTQYTLGGRPMTKSQLRFLKTTPETKPYFSLTEEAYAGVRFTEYTQGTRTFFVAPEKQTALKDFGFKYDRGIDLKASYTLGQRTGRLKIIDKTYTPEQYARELVSRDKIGLFYVELLPKGIRGRYYPKQAGLERPEILIRAELKGTKQGRATLAHELGHHLYRKDYIKGLPYEKQPAEIVAQQTRIDTLKFGFREVSILPTIGRQTKLPEFIKQDKPTIVNMFRSKKGQLDLGFKREVDFFRPRVERKVELKIFRDKTFTNRTIPLVEREPTFYTGIISSSRIRPISSTRTFPSISEGLKPQPMSDVFVDTSPKIDIGIESGIDTGQIIDIDVTQDIATTGLLEIDLGTPSRPPRTRTPKKPSEPRPPEPLPPLKIPMFPKRKTKKPAKVKTKIPSLFAPKYVSQPFAVTFDIWGKKPKYTSIQVRPMLEVWR